MRTAQPPKGHEVFRQAEGITFVRPEGSTIDVRPGVLGAVRQHLNRGLAVPGSSLWFTTMDQVDDINNELVERDRETRGDSEMNAHAEHPPVLVGLYRDTIFGERPVFDRVSRVVLRAAARELLEAPNPPLATRVAKDLVTWLGVLPLSMWAVTKLDASTFRSIAPEDRVNIDPLWQGLPSFFGGSLLSSLIGREYSRSALERRLFGPSGNSGLPADYLNSFLYRQAQ